MDGNSSDEFQRRLNLGRNGGGILFCGAGYSADCLNFLPDETLGTGAQLLDVFNTELSQIPPYRDLKNAADALRERIADHGMMELLKERFGVSEVTSDMVDLLRYPWESIYTTNYDNSIEIAALAAHKPAEPFNNTDQSDTASSNLPIIHLHGYVDKWHIHNFRESCVLGAESYSKLTFLKGWLDRFRRDVDQAQIVVFVGFNAGDFHINQAINDLTGLREKAYFINRPTSMADPDVMAAQKRVGTPLFVGRAGLAGVIRELLEKDSPREPRLASFTKYIPPDPATTVPTQSQIEDLFIYGKVEARQLARDSSNAVSEYHIQRSAVDETLAAIAGGVSVILLEGYPCDGKTLLTADLAYRLAGGRQVYQMRQAYESVLNEVADILLHVPNAALIIENCFDLPTDRLASIARQFDGQGGILILTSRAVSVDAIPNGLAFLEGLGGFQRIPIVSLNKNELQGLSDLADQIAGWRDFQALDVNTRLRFIKSTCQASLPHFLMRLLRSDYVTSRYREEFNRLSLSNSERAAVITALYVAHIGENATISLLSNTMGTDYAAIIDRLNARAGNESFRLVRRAGEVIMTVPSIGAQNILQNLFNDAEIVDAVVPLLKNLAAIYRNPLEQRIFNQLMRFSILSDVVTDKREIDRFFEYNKQEQQIRRMPLFWLQWHMAKCSAGELSVAEKLLEQGYGEANEFERRTGKTFDRRQLNDRRVKFLMLRAGKTNRVGTELFRDFKEAIELTGMILRQDDPQHYPFETLAEISQIYGVVGHHLMHEHRQLVEKILDQLTIYAHRRLGVLPSGYQRDKAQAALGRLGS